MVSTTGAMAAVARLLNAQNETFIDKGQHPWSADVPRHMRGIDMFLQRRGRKHTVSSGTDIVSLFNPEIEEFGGPKKPGAPHVTTEGGDLVRMRTPLQEYEWGKRISWHELNLNAGDPYTAEGSQKIWDIAEKTNQDFIVGLMKQLNNEFFAVPSAEMFAGDASGAYPIKSIWTGVNVWGTQHYDGGAAGNGGDGLFPVMSSQQGLDPNEAKFARRNDLGTVGGATQLSATKLTYSDAGNNNTGTGHILDRLQELMDLLDWEGVPMAGSYAQAMSMKPQMIMCSREAKTLLRRTVRAHGELFALVDPIGDPAQSTVQYGGVPLMISDEIRAAKVYPDLDLENSLDTDDAADKFLSTGGCDEFGLNAAGEAAGYAGGVYYFFDPDACNLYMHKDRAMEIGQWKNIDQINEDLYRRLAKMLGNIHHERFITHGILHPSASISGYAPSS